ncbi:MAG: response regulator [Syntrophobacteraceae bacterium]
MATSEDNVVILVAEDDEDDRRFVRDAFRELNFLGGLRFVADGVELMDYLRDRITHGGQAAHEGPDLIILDLNMPRMNGYEVLKELRSDRCFISMPVIVLSTSHGEPEVSRCYELGANAFVRKPDTYGLLLKAMGDLRKFWINISELPPKCKPARRKKVPPDLCN